MRSAIRAFSSSIFMPPNRLPRTFCGFCGGVGEGGGSPLTAFRERCCISITRRRASSCILVNCESEKSKQIASSKTALFQGRIKVHQAVQLYHAVKFQLTFFAKQGAQGGEQTYIVVIAGC